jgi:hypothetical protein
MPWRGANRCCHHLRIGHDADHLLEGHVHRCVICDQHLLGAHLLGAHLRDLNDGHRDDFLGDYQRDVLHRALHNDS